MLDGPCVTGTMLAVGLDEGKGLEPFAQLVPGSTAKIGSLAAKREQEPNWTQ